MNKDLEKRIFEKIKKENIKPIPRWFFTLKNSLFISIFSISIFIGSLAFSLLFYIFSDNQNYILEKYHFDKLKYAILFWIIILVLFLFIAIKNYKKIGDSYRYSPFVIFNWNILISIFIAWILFLTGVAQKTDEFSAKHLDFYQKNIRITEIKKEIFLKKLQEIGITKKLLAEHPELKEKIVKKFDEKVLGKKYLILEKNCDNNLIKCQDDELNFKDEKGCGCKKIYK